jgi:hypothetical protein
MCTATKVVLATVTAAAAVVGLGVTTASASGASSDTVVVPRFHESVKPWDSITIPAMSCPEGSYLVDQHLSPGRLVPQGVEVTELRNGLEPAGAVGVTIRDARAVAVEVTPGGYALPLVGTRADRGFSTATNWDPAASHTIVIRLHCTTDLSKAAKGLAADL